MHVGCSGLPSNNRFRNFSIVKFVSLLLYLLLLNCAITLLMNVRGEFALINVSLIPLTSFWKFEDVFLTWWSSPDIVLPLLCSGNLDSQETVNLLSILCTVVILHCLQ